MELTHHELQFYLKCPQMVWRMLKKRVWPLQTKGRQRLCICFLSWVKRKWNKGKVTTTKRILSILFIKEKFTSHHTCMSCGERLTFSLSYWHYTGNYFWLYLINGGSSFTSKNKGHTPNCEERKIATPSVLSFTEMLYGSARIPPWANFWR